LISLNMANKEILDSINQLKTKIEKLDQSTENEKKYLQELIASVNDIHIYVLGERRKQEKMEREEAKIEIDSDKYEKFLNHEDVEPLDYDIEADWMDLKVRKSITAKDLRVSKSYLSWLFNNKEL